MHHGLGEHTKREQAKKIEFDMSGAELMTVIVAEKEGHLSILKFNKLCFDINEHCQEGKISKPRIDDIFKIKGTS